MDEFNFSLNMRVSQLYGYWIILFQVTVWTMSEMAHHVRGIGLEGGLRGKGMGSEGGTRV